MAGFYPDVPSYRMAYDQDGTVVVRVDSSNNIYQRTAAEVAQLNDIDNGTVEMFPDYVYAPGGTARLVWIFPELRNVDSYFISASFNSVARQSIEWSDDTTNGVDGTWTLATDPWISNSPLKPEFRNSINNLGLTSVKAIRFNSSGYGGRYDDIYHRCVHLYGTIAAGENPNRLRLWQATTDAEIGPAFYDWADVPRGTTADKQFRIKNNSSTLTANDITVSTDALSDTNPSIPPQFTYSIGGSAFATSISITSLAPGALSDVITVRRTTPSNATLGLWNARTIVDAVSFS